VKGSIANGNEEVNGKRKKEAVFWHVQKWQTQWEKGIIIYAGHGGSTKALQAEGTKANQARRSETIT